VHVYTTPGTYFISLVTGNGTGCKDTLISTVPVIVGTTPDPSFTVTGNMGCPPLPVQFSNTSTNTDSTTVFNWNLGNGQTITGEEPAYTYQQAGIYSVTLTAVNGGVCSAAFTLNNIINVGTGTPPPAVLMKSVSVADTNAIDVTWGNLAAQDLNSYKLYRYNDAISSFELIYADNNPSNTSLNATTTYTDFGVNTSDTVYTYVVQAINECGAEVPLEQHVPHSSINLKVAIVDNVVQLEWNRYNGCATDGYEIYRQDNLTGSFNAIAMVDEESDYFLDSTVYCGMLVAYRIKAVNLCGEGFEAWSDIEEIDAPGILVNQKVDIVRSTVNDDSYVFTEWEPPSVAPQLVSNFELYRSTDNVNFTLIATLGAAETNYSDFNTNVKAQNYFYKVKVNNLCGLETTQGLPGSSILLNSFLDEENRSVLRWSPYRDWETGVDYYVIERIDLNGVWVPVGRVDGNELHYIDR
nr:PKD domain-containing protein [Bacteroidia bacterium]